ncbi:MAG: methyltransferase domain-containing protein [Pseudomonadota bacterium]
MGVDYVLFERLLELSRRYTPSGRVLMLGRQAFRVKQRERMLCNMALRKYGYSERVRDLRQEDGYSETLFEKLGFGSVESMDFSSYEGAEILHDLNKLPPKKLQGKFDLILDLGTIEHVFNVPVALESVYRMLQPEGRFVSANGMNGWYTHGMYQFSPELVWTFWRRACNCEVIDCRALPKDAILDFDPIPLSDPAETGRRLPLKNKIGPGRTYLYYEIQKSKDSRLPDFALQSDYEASWAGHENSSETSLDAVKR